jgi:hypothetical protein
MSRQLTKVPKSLGLNKEHINYLKKERKMIARWNRRCNNNEPSDCSKCNVVVPVGSFFDYWDELCFDCYYEVTHEKDN